MQNYVILANSDIDQKISTTGKQFPSQPDTTERRKTGNVLFFFRISVVSCGLYKPCWFMFMFISMVLDTTLVSSSFMVSKFEIPTSTSPTMLSTGENLSSIKIHFILTRWYCLKLVNIVRFILEVNIIDNSRIGHTFQI